YLRVSTREQDEEKKPGCTQECHEETAKDQRATKPGNEPYGGERGDRDANRKGRKAQRSPGGGEVQPHLEKERDDIGETTDSREESQSKKEPGSEATILKERWLDERIPGRLLVPAEKDKQDESCDEKEDGQQCPSVGRTLNQAIHQTEHGPSQKHGALGIEDHLLVASISREEPESSQKAASTEHDVDEEHRTPAQTCDIRVNQEACENGTQDGRNAEDWAESTERLAQ